MPSKIYNMEVAVVLKGTKLLSQTKKIKNAVKGLSKEKVNINTSASQKQMKDLDKSIAAIEKEIEQLTRKQESLKKQHVNTKQYKDLQKEADATKAKIASLNEMYQMLQSQAKMIEGYDPQMVRSMSDLEQQTAEADARLAELRSQMSAIEQNGATEKEAADWQNVSFKLSEAESKLASLNAQKQSTIAPTSSWEKFKSVIAGTASRAKELSRSLVSAVGGRIKSGLASLGKGMLDFGRKTLGASLNLKKMKRGMMMGTGIKGLARLGLIGAAVYNGVRMVKEGFQNLAQYSPSVNSAISQLMSSLNMLKNALAAAFAPILSVIGPILSRFITMLATAANAVAHFFGALTGKGTVAVAKKYATNYAKGIGGAGKAAGKAAKKQKKLNDNLLAFDQINKLTSNKNDTGGSVGGGGGGGGGVSPSDMFKTEKVSDAAKKFAKLLKKAWKKGDFTEIGKIVASKINKAMESIPWAKIKTTCKKIATSIGTFLNGFFKKLDWKLLGKTVSKGVIVIGESLATMIETIDWQQIGKSAVKFLSGVDWAGLIRTTFRLGGSVVGAIAGVIAGVVKEGFKGAKKYFKSYIEDSGGDIIAGVFKGIVAAIKKIPSWIKKNIFSPFIKGFKKAFGIGSPAKKMYDSGKDILLGVLEGVKLGFKALGKWFKDLPSNLQDMVDKGGELIVDVVANITGWAKDKFASISGTAVGLLGTVTGWVRGDKQSALSSIWNAGLALLGSVNGWAGGSKKDAMSSIWNAGLALLGSVTGWNGKKQDATKKIWGSVINLAGKATQWAKNGLKALNGTTVKLNGELVKVHAKGAKGSMVKAEGGTYVNGRWKPITAAANGGSFNQGQMFIAREAGPEMVGTIGGNTSVMNNSQIVSSVSAGVYKAVVAAMSQSDRGTTVVLQGDAAKFFRAMRKEAADYTMATGLPAFPV